MNKIKRIIITPGEPAGIGPNLVCHIAQLSWSVELVVVADPALLMQRAIQLQMPLALVTCDLTEEPVMHVPGILKIIPVNLAHQAIPGKLDAANAPYVINTLQVAVDICMQKKAAALVTGPVQKSILQQAGFNFQGHTEFLAQKCQVSLTIMLFVVDQLKVALTTTHLPLAKVPEAITAELLRETIILLRAELIKYFHIIDPQILISGLNPHAGEQGYLGQEEIKIMQPVIQSLQLEGFKLQGPLPADTMFLSHYIAKADAHLAMYHDQVLPLIKYIGFDRAVNVTLGLPFIRTSVDHGTGLDIAASNEANPLSLIAAIKLALKMA